MNDPQVMMEMHTRIPGKLASTLFLVVAVLSGCKPVNQPTSSAKSETRNDRASSPSNDTDDDESSDAQFPSVDDEIIEIPAPDGPFAVGTVWFQWEDPARDDTITDDLDDHRQLFVQIYYPAVVEDRSRLQPYVPLLDQLAPQLARAYSTSGERLAARLKQMRAHAVPQAPLDRSGAPYPVVVFSHGGKSAPHYYVTAGESLASHGYVVVGVSHPHAAPALLPDGRFIEQFEGWTPPKEMTDPVQRDQFFEPMTDIMGADLSFALDKTIQRNRDDPDGRFTGALDTAKVAAIGHSRGGKAVWRACAKDPRFAAAVVYMNIPPMAEQASGIRQPVLLVRTDLWPDEPKGRFDTFADHCSSPVYEVAIKGALQTSFSDAVLVFHEIYDELKQKGTLGVDGPRGLRITADYTLAFLDKTLRGADGTLLTAPSPDYPEVTITMHQP